MHQATRAGNVEIAKAILPIDICSHRRCALLPHAPPCVLAANKRLWYTLRRGILFQRSTSSSTRRSSGGDWFPVKMDKAGGFKYIT